MTTMLSLILAFMLSIGGSPAASVNTAGCPGDTGIQAPIDNNRTINRFFEDYREKTASRPISKKILEIPLIKQPKTQIRLRFSLYVKEELRLVGYMDSMNLYQGFGMNPVNFKDPFGKQSFLAEEELMQEEILKEHLIKRYGAVLGNQYYEEMRDTKRRIEGKMAVSFFLATGGMLVAPHLSTPALVATVGSISTYSALDAYSSRKQAGQTESEARRGAFGAATGLNFLFNLMGFDYGTLEEVSKEEVEDAWSNLIGGGFGIIWGKSLVSLNAKGISIIKYNPKAKRFYDASTGQFIKFKDVPWPKVLGFVSYKEGMAHPGQIVDRFGSGGGYYLAPEGTPYSMRGIPDGYVEFHKYEVLKPFKWFEGYTAPVAEFDSIGGGYQYMTTKKVKELVRKGYLKEIF